jgi:predicted patatin/cPLA2 family phospholipase
MQNLAGPSHPVIQEILNRRRNSGSAGASIKLGLVVEGGGLRGVISGAALVAMERLGFTEVFDEVYGESAGAINACYFLAAQAEFGSRIYFEDLPSLRFVNPFRPGRMLDLDYAIDVVVAHRKALNVERVLQSRSKLFIAVTNAKDASSKLIDVRKSRLPLLSLLKATGAIVPLYNKAIVLDGVAYVDGGISNPIPVLSAIQAGCTHILVLLTQPPEFAYRKLGRLQTAGARALLANWDARFVEKFFTERLTKYNQARGIAFGRIQTSQNPLIAVVAPASGDPSVSRMTLSSRRLKAALDRGIEKTLAVFQG